MDTQRYPKAEEQRGLVSCPEEAEQSSVETDG